MAPSPKHTLRETWLAALVTALRPWYAALNCPLPPKVRIACGWPSQRALSHGSRRVGECWDPRASADKSTEVFVSPMLANAEEVAGTAVHELVHAAVGNKCGHKGEFKRVAVALGLEGKMTSTTVGKELKAKLATVLAGLGPYPHAVLDQNKRKKQGTRMLKVSCPGCGYVVRTTQKWIEVGLPTCCCGEEMEQEG